MRKFKINEPLCKEYGGWVIIQEHDGKYLWGHKNGYIDAMDLVKLGLFEEVKEPEEFWWVNFYNHSKVEKSDKYGAVCVDPSARFQTKESAEKFVKALKESHGKLLEYWSSQDSDKYFVDSCEALNDRVK